MLTAPEQFGAVLFCPHIDRIAAHTARYTCRLYADTNRPCKTPQRALYKLLRLLLYHDASRRNSAENSRLRFKVSSVRFKAGVNGSSTFHPKQHRTPEKCHKMQNRAICTVSIRSSMQNAAGNSRNKYRRSRSEYTAPERLTDTKPPEQVKSDRPPDIYQIQRRQTDLRNSRPRPERPRPRPASTAGTDRRSLTAPAGFSAPGIG